MELKLTKDEVTQLYVLMNIFQLTGELKSPDYMPNGPARTLAKKITDFLGTFYGEATISKTTGK